MSNWSFNRRALDRMVNDSPAGRALFAKAATAIRNDARKNAAVIGRGGRKRDAQGRFVANSKLTDAIQFEVGSDERGLYADIGYDKRSPGFVLWWHEVGTVNNPATPHLRPAVKAGRL